MVRDVSRELNIIAQFFFTIEGGIRLPCNPQNHTRLTLKASSFYLDSRIRDEPIEGSYAIYMDDLIFFKGDIRNMIAERRAVYEPKENNNSCLLEPDFYLS